VHPFTIASVAGNTDNGPDGLVMIAKRCSPNGWTDRLYRLADEQRGFHGGRRVKVMVEGPYGGFGHVMPCSYSAMVLVCGGTGISFGIAALKELVQRDLRGECRVKVVRLIWVVTEPKSIMVLLKDFEDVVRRGSKTVSIKIDVYWTRSPALGAAASANSTNPFGENFRPKNIYLVSGRPTKAGLGKCLEDVIGITCRLGPPLGSGGPSGGLFSAKNRGRLRGVLVGVCGPREMGDEVVAVVNSVSKEKRERVGGVEVYEEVFGY
jgi:ferric-chelate reductase